MGFRVHWDGIRRRFTILNVARKKFILRGGCSSLATGETRPVVLLELRLLVILISLFSAS